MSAVCDSTGFTITVDETCRGTYYDWIDWTSTFANGAIAVKEMPGGTAGTSCAAVGSGAAWEYTVGFAECGILAPVLSAADANDIKWYTYSIYINYDNDIATAQGTGNLQQLDQTLVECRIPANFQENAIAGDITVTDTNDLIPDETSDVELWDELQLDVLVYDLTSSAYGTALSTGSSIQLGDKVKLQINQKTGTAVDVTTGYK